MKLVPEMIDRLALPLLVGCYEEELHHVIVRLSGYRTVVNIGSSHGYYAVGLALRMTEANVLAFDIDRSTHQICRKLCCREWCRTSCGRPRRM